MHYNQVNEFLNGKMNITNPKVGMCATMFCGSDRWPMVVTEVISPTQIRVDDMDRNDYDDEPITDDNGVDWLPNHRMSKYTKVNKDKTGFVSTGNIYTFRKNQRWMKKGEDAWGTGAIMIGKADLYRDPNF